MSPNQINRQDRFELRTLLETGRLLIESQDPDFVLNNLLLITMGKLMVASGMILMYNPGEESYTVTSSKGQRMQPQNQRIPLELSPEIKNTAILRGDEYQELFNLLEIPHKSILFNLKSNNYHIGFLCLAPKVNNEAFQTHELEFIESLAIISSVALSNSRLFRELKYINKRLDRKVHDLNTLLQLSKDFNLMVDSDEIIRVFKFALLGHMLIRNFFFILEVNGLKSVVSTSGLKSGPSPSEIENLYSRKEIETISEDEPCEFLRKNGIKLLVGLNFQNEKIGVIGVGTGVNNHEFSESDINFIQSLGNLALLTIQKTILLEERLEKNRMEKELSLAKTIQKGFLPTPLPEIEGFDIAAANVSSQQVGGDYYDLIRMPNGEYTIAIADVTGKGVPAALLMANLQSMLHALAPIPIDFGNATSSINDIIYKNTPADKFITFFWGKISPKKKILNYVNAGHNPPLLLKKGASVPQRLEKGGLILGALPSAGPYPVSEIKLESEDLLVLYTDGVTEAFNKNRTEEYGEDRLLKCILQNKTRTSQAILDAILTDIDAFSAHFRYDDITLIVLKVE